MSQMLSPLVLRHVCLFLSQNEMKKVLMVSEAENQLETFQYLRGSFWVDRAEALHGLRGLTVEDALVVESLMSLKGSSFRSLMLDTCSGIGSVKLLEVLLQDPRVDPGANSNHAIG